MDVAAMKSFIFEEILLIKQNQQLVNELSISDCENNNELKKFLLTQNEYLRKENFIKSNLMKIRNKINYLTATIKLSLKILVIKKSSLSSLVLVSMTTLRSAQIFQTTTLSLTRQLDRSSLPVLEIMSSSLQSKTSTKNHLKKCECLIMSLQLRLYVLSLLLQKLQPILEVYCLVYNFVNVLIFYQ